MNEDIISRQAAIDALWKALYEYEDKTEKQFQESEDLDIRDWGVHRIFVQNMSDIDRKTILDLPSAERHGRWEVADDMPMLNNTFTIRCSLCGQLMLARPNDENPNFRCNCGASMTDDNATQHTERVENALGALAELENGIYGVRDGQVYKMRCATPEELFPNAKKVKINLMAATEEEEDG